MKTLIYILLVSLFIIGCEKAEQEKPIEHKPLPKIKTVRLYINPAELGGSRLGANYTLTVSGLFMFMYDSLNRETKTSVYAYINPRSDTTRWFKLEAIKTRIQVHVSPDNRDFYSRRIVFDRDSMTLVFRVDSASL